MALVVMALSFGAAQAAADGVKFGVNDDEGMFQKGSGPFFANLVGLGMHDNTVTVRWDETSPDGFEVLDPATNVTLKDFLPATVAAAGLAGVTLTFDVYPRHSQAAGDSATNAPKFAAWLTELAKTFPTVKHYVVMNECNQPLFVNPQYDRSGKLVSAADCGEFLAAGYQALKSVNQGNFVWGIGLSPHGAKVDGKSHRDSSPFDFLSALGTWYKGSKYSGQPIMDGLDLHPYPIPQSVPFAQGNSNAGGPAYGVATLPLVYQAFYDAFKGTAQPTVGPGRLPVSLNEVGIQTIPSVGGYTGAETAGWGVGGPTGSEDHQAQWYKQMIDATQCDASITNVNIFKLLDQSDLGAWQSGLYQLGWVAKSSAQVVKNEIASVASCPTGAAKLWSPAAPSSGGGDPNDDLATKVVPPGFGMVSGNPALYFSSLPLPGGVPDLPPTAYLEEIIQGLGEPLSPLDGKLDLIPIPQGTPVARTPASAYAKPASKSVKFKVKKGARLKLPQLPKLTAGAYKARFTFTAKGIAGQLVLTTNAFYVDAKGMASSKAPKPTKAKKSKAPEPKTKPAKAKVKTKK
jgi:hypothetical protein